MHTTSLGNLMQKPMFDLQSKWIMLRNQILWYRKALVSNAFIFFFIMLGMTPEHTWSREQIQLNEKTFFGINRDCQAGWSEENQFLFCMDVKGCTCKERNFVQTPGLLSVYFKRGSARLGTKAKSDLDSICVVLRKFPELMITLEGHSDRMECLKNTKSLSEKRVEACASYLSMSGIKRERFISKACSADPAPPHQNGISSGMKNRRVDIVMIGR